jgi:hypothetical protein
MPFRFPDQWLMFCGVMRRVLAANGLIHPENPDDYRHFLEETPYVRADEDEGPGELPKMPQGWASCYRLRTIQSMQEAYNLLQLPKEQRGL